MTLRIRIKTSTIILVLLGNKEAVSKGGFYGVVISTPDFGPRFDSRQDLSYMLDNFWADPQQKRLSIST